jgi:hypothetical protein
MCAGDGMQPRNGVQNDGLELSVFFSTLDTM